MAGGAAERAAMRRALELAATPGVPLGPNPRVGCVLLAPDGAVVAGEVFNLGEATTPTMRLRAEQILSATGSSAVLVEVPDDVLPPDLGITAHVAQPLLVSSAKAAERLGWQPSDPVAALARTVAWHLEHRPAPDGDDDLSADDAALAAVVS